MFRQTASKWRLAKRAVEEFGHSFSKCSGETAGQSSRKAWMAERPYSSGRPNPLNEEAVNSRLFERAKATPLPAEDAEAVVKQLSAPSTAGKIASRIGNTLFFGLLGVSSYFGYYTYRCTTDEINDMVAEAEKPENSYPGSQLWVEVMSIYADQRAKIEGQVKMFSDPTSEKLLPDQPPQYRHVQTLVLDLDDLLVHSHWTRGRGWRTFKRPGVEDFIKHMGQFYEIVVFTNQLSSYADPIMERLDPQHIIQYRLYRGETYYKDGKHLRDLSKLNRDLSKVVMVTTDPGIVSLQSENGVIVKPWKLEEGDTTLLDLIPFLEAVCSARQMDVRDIISTYKGQDIPTAFRERMKLAGEQQRQRQKKSVFGSLR